MDAPSYPHKSIYSIKALSRALDEPEQLILDIAKRASSMYQHVPQTKKNGEPRNTYDAYEPLKRIQRKIVDRILSRVQFPQYLHGGIRDRHKPRSIYTNARPHCGQNQFITIDIKDFFPSISSKHAQKIFQGLFEFSKDVSSLLAQLTTRLEVLPQGASTSSYLANLIFWDIEPTLEKAFRDEGITYSRFADDITLSANYELSREQTSNAISRVVNMLAQKGCSQKRSKLHIRKRGQSVRGKAGNVPMTVTGLGVYNDKPNISKAERKKIRASVREVENLAEQGALTEELKKLMNRASGRIGRLKACKHKEANELFQRIRSIRCKNFSITESVR